MIIIIIYYITLLGKLFYIMGISYELGGSAQYAFSKELLIMLRAYFILTTYKESTEANYLFLQHLIPSYQKWCPEGRSEEQNENKSCFWGCSHRPRKTLKLNRRLILELCHDIFKDDKKFQNYVMTFSNSPLLVIYLQYIF
ncbi:hypothetical protein HHI36_002577 [Cryptolaemus montrouzieri]|uniref:Uncharacterized protein n=1 Tax=Cryptolaemus montrouzieri TaxID=559131 RepID=A0ABD2PBJ6_9CUCU